MVKTESGCISGLTTQDGTVSIFRGIPYAAPPVGDLRWKAPQKMPSWQGVRECTRFGSSAIQAPQAPFMMWTEEFIIDPSTGYSEDCLTLNIYCPSDTNEGGKPVVVYFHGGSYVTGGSSCEVYNGEQLARHGVIFVTVNFRVAILGLFSCSELSRENPEHTSGNYQLLDQIAALKWVKNNIRAFGGDPDNVTIMGQSSGCGAVCMLSVSPMARGLFRHVFAMSYDALNMAVSTVTNSSGGMSQISIYGTPEECERTGDSVIVGGLDHMRSMTPDELGKLQPYYPYCIDGKVLTHTFNEGVRAGLSNDYDFMLTYTADDYVCFLLLADTASQDKYEPNMRAYFGELADRAMKLYPFTGKFVDYPALNISIPELAMTISRDRYTASTMMLPRLRKNANTWAAEFAHVMPGPESQMWGSFHTSDVPYWLDYYSDKRKEYWTESDYALGRELVVRLAAFAKTGSPNAEGLASWRPSDGNSIYRIDTGVMEEVRPLDEEKYQFWRDVYCVN